MYGRASELFLLPQARVGFVGSYEVHVGELRFFFLRPFTIVPLVSIGQVCCEYYVKPCF